MNLKARSTLFISVRFTKLPISKPTRLTCLDASFSSSAKALKNDPSESKEGKSGVSDSEKAKRMALLDPRFTEKKARREEYFRFCTARKEEYSVPVGLSPEKFPPAKYLGGDLEPFPLNPLFRHTPPLSEAKKEAIFQTFLKDPKKYTPRVLGTLFKISMRRIQAILNLKHLKLDMIKNKGFKPLRGYEVGMSRILRAGMNEIEDLEPINIRLKKPQFKVIDEDEEFTTKDAVKALNTKDFTELTEEMLTSKPFVYHGLSGRDNFVDVEPTPAPLANEPGIGSHRKFNYIFSDINPNLSFEERAVLIREKNGILRLATKLESARFARRTDWPLQDQLFKRTVGLPPKKPHVPSTLNP